MDKQEYLQKKKAVRAEIERLKRSSEALTDSYIKETLKNSGFSVGDKVEYRSRWKPEVVEVGFIKEPREFLDGEITVTLSKVKKDGTAHPRQNINYCVSLEEIKKI